MGQYQGSVWDGPDDLSALQQRLEETEQQFLVVEKEMLSKPLSKTRDAQLERLGTSCDILRQRIATVELERMRR